MAEDRQVDTEFQETTQRLTQAELDARRASRRASQQRRRRNSVFQYIAILFMAAFVLLLYTFMMERRQSQQQIDDLKQSASTVQTLQGLMEENASLQAKVSELETLLEAEQSAAREFEINLETAADGLAHTENVLAWTTEAMTWFWELNDAYVRGRLTQCRELITQMESQETNPPAGSLAEYLPKENVTGTDHSAPYDRYQEIRSRIIK